MVQVDNPKTCALYEINCNYSALRGVLIDNKIICICICAAFGEGQEKPPKNTTQKTKKDQQYGPHQRTGGKPRC